MAKTAKRSKFDIVPTVAIGELTQVDDFVEQSDQKRRFVTFSTLLTFNGKIVDAHVKLIQNGKQWKPSHPDHYAVRVVANKKAAGESHYSCPHCGGNWGVSTPETPGLVSVELGKALVPLLEAKGFKIDTNTLGERGGIRLEMYVQDKGEVADTGKAPRFMSAWSNLVVCPVHGEYKLRTVEAS